MKGLASSEALAKEDTNGQAAELTCTAFFVRRRSRREGETVGYCSEIEKRMVTPKLRNTEPKHMQGETSMAGRLEIYLREQVGSEKEILTARQAHTPVAPDIRHAWYSHHLAVRWVFSGRHKTIGTHHHHYCR